MTSTTNSLHCSSASSWVPCSTPFPKGFALARREELDYSAFLQIILTDEINRRDHRRLEVHFQKAGVEEVCPS